MKKRMIFVFLLIAVLLTSSNTLAKSEGMLSGYSVIGTASGGGYTLTKVEWKFDGSSSGGGYYLLSPESPELRGLSGCCCEFLPCVLKEAGSDQLLFP